MSMCPNCDHSLGEDFGLVDCQGCGLSVLVGLDGNVESQKHVPPAINEPINALPDKGDFNSVSDELSFKQDVSISSADVDEGSLIREHDELPADSSITFDDEYSQQVDESFESVYTSATGVEAVYEDEFTSFETTSVEGAGTVSNYEAEVEESIVAAPQGSTEVKEASSMSVPENALFQESKHNRSALESIQNSQDISSDDSLKSISDYANSEQSSALSGLYTYTIYLSGIDSYDLKERVFSELGDKQLFLDVSGLTKKFKNGELNINHLSAVKASVLVNRLSYLPISILWDQHDVRKA